MTTVKKIVIFMGSVRPGRKVERAMIAVKDVVIANGMEPIILDPLEIPFELVKKPLHFMKDIEKESPDWLLEVDNKIQSADGFIIVSPEYNCGIPPPLGNMMDHFPATSYYHRPCGIVTYAPTPYGGIRTHLVLRPFLAELGMISTPFTVPIPCIQETISPEGKVLKESLARRLNSLVQEVAWYADALKNQKKQAPPPHDIYVKVLPDNY